MRKREECKNIILQKKMREYSRYCKCGHSVIVAPVGAKEFFICSWCGCRIYRDLKKQKEYDERCARNEFKYKLNKLMNN